MRIEVAGKDRHADLGESIAAEAAGLSSRQEAPDFIAETHSAVLLCNAGSEREYLDRLLRLVWMKSGVVIRDFHIPRRPGWVGGLSAWFKGKLWRVLGYQHHRMAFQQNTINAQISAALEFVRAEQLRNHAELARRMGELEDAVRALREGARRS